MKIEILVVGLTGAQKKILANAFATVVEATVAALPQAMAAMRVEILPEEQSCDPNAN